MRGKSEKGLAIEADRVNEDALNEEWGGQMGTNAEKGRAGKDRQ